MLLLLSLTFFIQGDWQLSPADKQYVQSAFEHQAHDTCLADMQFAGVPATLDLVTSPLDSGPFNLILRSGDFYDPLFPGLLLSGLFTEPGPGHPVPTIQLNWQKDVSGGGTWNLLAHEVCHWMMLTNAQYTWPYFLHGRNAPTGMDLYLNKVLAMDRRAYPYGHSSDPIAIQH